MLLCGQEHCTNQGRFTHVAGGAEAHEYDSGEQPWRLGGDMRIGGAGGGEDPTVNRVMCDRGRGGDGGGGKEIWPDRVGSGRIGFVRSVLKTRILF